MIDMEDLEQYMESIAMEQLDIKLDDMDDSSIEEIDRCLENLALEELEMCIENLALEEWSN
ncbi:MAG: hypothetical protein BEN18_07350 [Epulopiscium sp. Nuni2H_MBin001]|nr:MAG: hypothetical protein BEN18_07350 [Epulopiscium sp. Nuni2H_MBin001]